MANSYTTTVFQPRKSYPTYQFHACSACGKLPVADIFKVCILETFRWLRARLQDYPQLPQELKTPEPTDFSQFDLSELHSFQLADSIQVHVVYAENAGIWSFLLTESDMGENLGTATERLPVIGRSFLTEISFRVLETCVEIGVRTICEEPMDTTAPCEVFRPTVVKALAENPNVGLRQSGRTLTKSAFCLKESADITHFCELFEDDSNNLPLVLVGDAPCREPAAPAVSLSDAKLPVSVIGGFGGGFSAADVVLTNSEKSSPFADAKKKVPAPKKTPTLPKSTPKPERLAPFPSDRLAESLLGFAVVCDVPEAQLSALKNKEGIALSLGEIAVFQRGQEIERYRYHAKQDDPETVFQRVKKDLRRFPKRRAYNYGSIAFHSDAKLIALRERQLQTDSLEERCELYRQENTALKQQTAEFSRQNTDMQLRENELRKTRKLLKTAEAEKEELQAALDALRTEYAAKEEAFRGAADMVAFYRARAAFAAGYPQAAADVCGWAEEHFSAEMIVAPRAKSEMKKYDGALDIPMLCDGLLYLDAYAKFRRQEISEDVLRLYAMENGWEATFSGKEAVRVRQADYAVTIDGQKYILDMHIKHGVSAACLLRVYFCYDETLQKLIIGSMPEHLATVRCNT